MQPGDPKPKVSAPSSSGGATGGESTGMGVGLYAVIVLGGLAAYGAYNYMQAQSQGAK